MPAETVVLIIAQNGLKAAATVLTAKAAKQQKQAERATDEKEKAKLTKSAAKTKKLAAILTASDQGITSYMVESET